MSITGFCSRLVDGFLMVERNEDLRDSLKPFIGGRFMGRDDDREILYQRQWEDFLQTTEL